MIYRTSKLVATLESYWNILKLETYECDFYSVYSLKDFYILSTFLIGNVCNKLLQLNSIILRLIEKRALQNSPCGEVNYIC